jgi:acyl carrier protein
MNHVRIPNLNLEQLFEPFSPPITNLADRVRYWAEAKPDAVSYYYLLDGEDEQVSLTYAELDQKARAIGAYLVGMGMRGKRALLLYPPGIEFVAAFFGCYYAGAVPVPAYPPRRNRNMGRINLIADDCEAAIAMSVHDVIDRIDGMLDDSPSLTRIKWLATEGIPDEVAGDWRPAEIHGDDIALLQYTSGSTGSPKGVVLTHNNLMNNCAMITEAFQCSRNGMGMSWLPTYHDMGLVGGVVNPCYIGEASILMSPMAFLAKPVRWLRAMSRFKAAISGGPNFAYALCVEKITEEECEGLDLSSWRVAFNGAEPIRAETITQFSEKFAPYGFKHEAHYPCYGMAENTLIVTGGDPAAPPILQCFDERALSEHKVVPLPECSETSRRLVGCGSVLRGEEILVVDPDTLTPAPEQTVGEIWLNSISMGTGYWNNVEETRNKFQAKLADGEEHRHYLRTGDLGFFHQGQLYVTGRLKDLIIIRGVNHYPQDIEETVEHCSDRLRSSCAAAFSVEHGGRERLIIVCEVERSRNLDWSDVVEAIRRNVTAEHELPPDAVVLVRAGSILKTSSGKIQRRACRQAFLEDKLLLVERWIGWEQTAPVDGSEHVNDSSSKVSDTVSPAIVEVVMENVRLVAKERARKLDLETNIVVDLGLDSLERLQIVNGLEEAFGGRFPDEVLQEIETIGEVAEAVARHIGNQPQTIRRSVKFDPTERRVQQTRDIPESYFLVEKMPEYLRLQREKNAIRETGLRNPFFSVHEGVIADTTKIGGKSYISFSSYNYLGLSGTPEVSQSAKQAIDQFGTSVSASRLVSGEKTLHRELEAELATFLGVEDVITFAGGHATNESVIGHLLGPGDLIIHDALAHNSIVQGALLSGARRRPFPHNSWQELDAVLSEIRHEYRRVMIAIEGLYSMDGDYPDVERFVEIKKKHKAWLFVDEAHSIGTLGASGRGIAELQNIDRSDVELWMGTLSKSFASCGGFIGGSKALVEYLRYTTPGFVFAAGIPPGNVGAALGALRMMQREPGRVTRLHDNAWQFLKLAREADLNTGFAMGTAIVPIITGSSIAALQLAECLFRNGINAQPIIHPAVEDNQARIRFFISAAHKPEQIESTVQIVSREWKKIQSQ